MGLACFPLDRLKLVGQLMFAISRDGGSSHLTENVNFFTVQSMIESPIGELELLIDIANKQVQELTRQVKAES